MLTATLPDHAALEDTLEALELRLRTILPEEYQDNYEDVQPVSMGSASLQYLSNGLVAWNQIWASFCDLAMAGGPPHKGTFLEPGTRAEIDAHPERYRLATLEICRGVEMATGLKAAPSTDPGWVRVYCESAAMAQWLVRAIIMENIAARCSGAILELPAGPHYRVAKEIKNVVTAIAKTCHYWLGHMGPAQQTQIAELFATMAADLPVQEPAWSGDEDHGRKLGIAIEQATGLRATNYRYATWVGLECGEVHKAIWMMRALVVSNVLSRREGTTLFLPINPKAGCDSVVNALARVQGFAATRGIL